jgi:phosphate transport system permease protein/phosphate transport system substrate-binding protein
MNKSVYIVAILLIVIAGLAFVFVNPPQKKETTTYTTLTTTTATTTTTTATTPTTTTITATPTMSKITLNGAGATFPFPLYDKWCAEYNKLYPNIFINYQSIGSGGGIRAHLDKTVHFAASDAPLNDEQWAKAQGTLTLPMTIGGVVIIYNLPGLNQSLILSGEVISKIYLGEINKWNDPLIASLNPGIALPDKDIVVVHRSDGSGTTYVFTNYLSRVSDKWRSTVGMGTSVNWPTGVGAKGNEGVSAMVMQTPYSIGYVEYTYAKKNNIKYAYIVNAAGEVVEPSTQSFQKAVEYAALKLPKGNESWANVSIVDMVATNKDAKGAYPITSFSYIFIYKDLSVVPGMDKATAQALVNFLWWATHDGQKYAEPLFYVPLPESVVKLNEETLLMVTYGGEPLIKK